MIDAKRPLCAVIPADFDNYHHRELRTALSDTLDMDCDEPGRIHEACAAEWPKAELDEHGQEITRVEFGYTTRVCHYVKCMEPARYYMNIPYAMGGGSFCEFHRPRVREF